MERSGMFDSTETIYRRYSQEDFADYHKSFVKTGVRSANDLVVSASGHNVTLASGYAFIEGFYYKNTENLTFEIPSSSSRRDRLVIRLNKGLETATANAVVKQGTPSSPPPLSREGDIYEISLATIYVTTSGITITDERGDVAVCGIVQPIYTTNDLVPPGAIFYFAAANAPAGYLVCDGSAVSRSTYSKLFVVCNITYGAGNGSTTFNLPDLRGEFIRGWDNGRGVDPGRTFGSWKQGTKFTTLISSGMMLESSSEPEEIKMQKTMVTTENDFSLHEAKLRMAAPRNIALLPCIKY